MMPITVKMFISDIYGLFAWREKHRDNIEADTPSTYWKRAVYVPFLDHLVSGSC